jgi:hypothetical protein
VARIDTPLLDSIWITFVRHPIIDIPQLAHFLRRTTRFEALKEAHVDLDGYDVQVESFPPTRTSDANSALIISCRQLYWPVPSLTQVFTSFFTSIYMVEDLYIFEPQKIPPRWQDDIENIEWLEIFRPFTAVKNLYICEKFAQQLASSLQALVGKSDKCVSRPGGPFFRRAQAIWTCSGSCRTVRCRTTAFWSTCGHFLLGRDNRRVMTLILMNALHILYPRCLMSCSPTFSFTLTT